MLTDKEILKAYHIPSWDEEDAHMKGLREIAKAQYKAIIETMKAPIRVRANSDPYSTKKNSYNPSLRQSISTR
jgi:hypothetical protein